MIYSRNILKLIFKVFSRFICAFIPNKNLRHKVRDFFDYTSPRNVTIYFKKKYLPYLSCFKEEKKGEKSNYVFQCWLQGEENAPEVVKKCIDSVRKFSIDKKYVLITKYNLTDWISDIPIDIINKYEKGIIGPAHFADILRLCLLSKYGGYWIDATCLMTGKFPEWIDESEFFMFHSIGVFSYTLINNCFIYSYPHHYLIDTWKFLLLEFWKQENSVYNYFDSHFLFCAIIQNDLKAMSEFNKMPKVYQTDNHRFLSLWYEEFNEDKLKMILENSFIHKLTYKPEKNKKQSIKNSFYDMFVKNDLDYILKCSPR